jgi:hypothetical protein
MLGTQFVSNVHTRSPVTMRRMLRVTVLRTLRTLVLPQVGQVLCSIMPSRRWFFDLAGKLVEDEAFEVHLVGGVVDVDADEAAVLVVVQYDAFGNLAAVRARTVSELDVQRIRSLRSS